MLHQPNTYLQLNIYCLLYISIGGGTDNIIGLGGGGSGNYSAMADRVCVCVRVAYIQGDNASRILISSRPTPDWMNLS